MKNIITVIIYILYFVNFGYANSISNNNSFNPPGDCETYADLDELQPYPNYGWNNQFNVGGTAYSDDVELCFDISELVGTNAVMIGLNDDPLLNASYTSIDYAIYIRKTTGNDLVYIYESGSYKGQYYNSPNTIVGKNICIKRQNGLVRYFLDGNLIYTSKTPSAGDLYFDNSFLRYASSSVFKATNIEMCIPPAQAPLTDCDSIPSLDYHQPFPVSGYNQFDVGDTPYPEEVQLCFDIEEVSGTNHYFIGLSEDPLEEPKRNTIDHSFLVYSVNGRYLIYVYENGVYKRLLQNNTTTFVGKTLCIKRSEGIVDYIIDDVLLYTSLNPSTASLYYDNACYNYNNPNSILKIANLQICKSASSVDVNDSRYDLAGFGVVDAGATATLPPVAILDTESQVGSINVLIDNNIHGNFYSSYYIERSTDSINFVQLNTEPYVFVGADTDDINEHDPYAADNVSIAELRSAVFADSVATFDYYYYRVIGMNNLGQISEPSHIVKEKARRPRLEFNLYVDTTAYNVDTDDMTIHLPSFPDSVINRLIGFQMYKSVFNDGPFDLMNTEILDPNTTSYVDIDPYLSTYYTLVAWDLEGYEYKSYSYLAQLPDMTAPPVPSMTSAVYINDQSDVRITWDPVYAEDLEGYYVFFANGKNGVYNPINSTPYTDSTAVKNFNIGMEIDSIFFKVAAIDKRGNTSDSSEPMGIRRPGKYGASEPIIHSVYPNIEGGKGMELSFSFSPDENIKYHYLQRRSVSNAEWANIKKIMPPDQSDYSTGPNEIAYIDKSYIRNETLEYRIIVTDLDDLITGSEAVVANPVMMQQVGYINDLTITKESSQVEPPALPQFSNPLAQQLAPRYSHSITLTWVYDDTRPVESFSIYRKITGGNLIDYRTMRPTELHSESIEEERRSFTFHDAGLMPDKRYSYAVVAKHRDGTTSHMTHPVSVLIEQL